MADLVDLGASNNLDRLYEVFLSSQFFKSHPFSELTVVDLGAGKGSRLAQLLSERGAKLIAVDWVYDDPDFPLRYQAQKVAADVIDSGLGSAMADVVISAHVTLNNSYFAESDVQKRYLNEVVRLLKPGGIFWGEEKDISAELSAATEGICDCKYFPDAYVHSFIKAEQKIT